MECSSFSIVAAPEKSGETFPVNNLFFGFLNELNVWTAFVKNVFNLSVLFIIPNPYRSIR